LLGSFAGLDHELPAVANFAHQHSGGGTFRVADPDIDLWEAFEIVNDGVVDQARLIKIKIVKSDAGSLADWAARSIRPNKIAGTNLLWAVWRLQNSCSKAADLFCQSGL
jgi:hypothetical protein